MGVEELGDELPYSFGGVFLEEVAAVGEGGELGRLSRHEEAEMALVVRCLDPQAGLFEGFEELRVVKPVFAWMVEQSPCHGMAEEPLEHLFCVEAPSGLENSTHLSERSSPIGNVMENPKIKDGVIGCVL